MQSLRFTITFKRRLLVVAELRGFRAVPTNELTVADMDDVIKVEQLLERLTGYRVHITTNGESVSDPV